MELSRTRVGNILKVVWQFEGGCSQLIKDHLTPDPQQFPTLHLDENIFQKNKHPQGFISHAFSKYDKSRM